MTTGKKTNTGYVYKKIRCIKCYKSAKEEEGSVHGDEIHFSCDRCGCEYVVKKVCRYAICEKTAAPLVQEKRHPLIQCPFCGSEAVLTKDDNVYSVICPKCHAQGGAAKVDHVAAKYWNQRAGCEQ